MKSSKIHDDPPVSHATADIGRACRRAAMVLAILVSPTSAIAQDSRIDTLIVVDPTGLPVPFSNVSLKGGIAQITNANGMLTFRADADTITMLVRRLGFDAYQGKIGRAPDTHIFRITLAQNAQSLKKVVVTEAMSAGPLSRAGFYDRMMEVKNGAPMGEFFTPEDLEARSTSKISDFLYASRYAKIQQTTTQFVRNGGGYAERLGRPRRYILGRASCAMTVVVDGVVMRNMLGDLKDADGDAKKAFDDSRTALDDVVNGPEVMAIEVYPSAATAPLSMAARVLGSACGIVAIWTGGR